MRTLFLALLMGFGGLADACEKPNRFEKAAKQTVENMADRSQLNLWIAQFRTDELSIDEFLDLAAGMNMTRNYDSAIWNFGYPKSKRVCYEAFLRDVAQDMATKQIQLKLAITDEERQRCLKTIEHLKTQIEGVR